MESPSFLFYVLATSLLFSTLLVHEAGHWMLLRRWGVSVVRYEIGFGPKFFKLGCVQVNALPIGAAVVPQTDAYQALSAKQRAWVALAGPLASFAYAAVILVNWPWFDYNPGILKLALLSFYLGLLNLLPVPPLDGFKALEAVIEHRRGPLSERAKSLCYRAGSGVIYAAGFFLLTKVVFEL